MIKVLQWLLCRALHGSIRWKDQEKQEKALPMALFQAFAGALETISRTVRSSMFQFGKLYGVPRA